MVESVKSNRIEVITGCMFAGKTQELLRRLRRSEIAGFNIVVFSPEIDDRYGKKTIGSHTGEEWEATVVSTDSSGLQQIYEESNGTEIVAIDEINFFDENIIPVVEELANNGSRVILSGIDQTFRGEPFSPVDKILAVADDVTKLNAVCEVCGNKATKTQRLINGEPAPEDSPTIQIGGNDSYQARCRDCHIVPR